MRTFKQHLEEERTFRERVRDWAATGIVASGLMNVGNSIHNMISNALMSPEQKVHNIIHQYVTTNPDTGHMHVELNDMTPEHRKIFDEWKSSQEKSNDLVEETFELPRTPLTTTFADGVRDNIHGLPERVHKDAMAMLKDMYTAAGAQATGRLKPGNEWMYGSFARQLRDHLLNFKVDPDHPHVAQLNDIIEREQEKYPIS